jgi:cytoskeletal protein CcmA (bactofilin family)
MRHKRLLAAVLLLVGLTAFSFTGLANAQSFKGGDSVTVPGNERLDKTLFSAGNSLDIAGTVNGDVFCAGQTVHISGTVTGDVICVAQTITISGNVEGSVRLAGQTVTINGNVGSSASIAAQTFTSGSQSRIGTDISLASETATLNGLVNRDTAFTGTTLTLTGSIGRDITGNMQRFVLSDTARINGGGSYTSPKKAEVAKGAVITGNLAYSTPKPKQQTGPAWGMRFYFFLAFLFAALLLVLAFPGLFQQATQFAITKPFKTMVTGLVASIAVPVALVALLFTVIGIPLSLILWIVWFVVCAFSSAFAAYYLGRLILKGTTYTNAILYMLLGAATLLVLSYIPLINVLSWLASLWFGLGIIVLHVYNRYSKPSYSVKD